MIQSSLDENWFTSDHVHVFLYSSSACTYDNEINAVQCPRPAVEVKLGAFVDLDIARTFLPWTVRIMSVLGSKEMAQREIWPPLGECP